MAFHALLQEQKVSMLSAAGAPVEQCSLQRNASLHRESMITLSDTFG